MEFFHACKCQVSKELEVAGAEVRISDAICVQLEMVPSITHQLPSPRTAQNRVITHTLHPTLPTHRHLKRVQGSIHCSISLSLSIFHQEHSSQDAAPRNAPQQPNKAAAKAAVAASRQQPLVILCAFLSFSRVLVRRVFHSAFVFLFLRM